MPTASAVVADLVGVAMGTTPLLFKRLQHLPRHRPRRPTVLPFDQTADALLPAPDGARTSPA